MPQCQWNSQSCLWEKVEAEAQALSEGGKGSQNHFADHLNFLREGSRGNTSDRGQLFPSLASPLQNVSPNLFQSGGRGGRRGTTAPPPLPESHLYKWILRRPWASHDLVIYQYCGQVLERLISDQNMIQNMIQNQGADILKT